MAKLTGPLLSMGAKGQIGKGLVVSNWKGIKYARQYVTPANPRTTAQQANRSMFAFLREMWKLAPAAVRAPWTRFAKGRPFTDMNKFVGENIRLIASATDLQAMLASPGAAGGLPPAGVVAATGSNAGEVVVTVTPPDQLPDGWTISACGAAACHQQDAHEIFSGPFVAATDASDPYAITLSGLGAGELCQCWGWVIYEKPDGSLAYSVSVGDEATADA